MSVTVMSVIEQLESIEVILKQFNDFVVFDQDSFTLEVLENVPFYLMKTLPISIKVTVDGIYQTFKLSLKIIGLDDPDDLD